jgi:hypothetical protein
MTTLHRIATAGHHLGSHLAHTTWGATDALSLTAALALALHELAHQAR